MSKSQRAKSIFDVIHENHCVEVGASYAQEVEVSQ